MLLHRSAATLPTATCVLWLCPPSPQHATLPPCYPTCVLRSTSSAALLITTYLASCGPHPPASCEFAHLHPNTPPPPCSRGFPCSRTSVRRLCLFPTAKHHLEPLLPHTQHPCTLWLAFLPNTPSGRPHAHLRPAAPPPSCGCAPLHPNTPPPVCCPTCVLRPHSSNTCHARGVGRGCSTRPDVSTPVRASQSWARTRGEVDTRRCIVRQCTNN